MYELYNSYLNVGNTPLTKDELKYLKIGVRHLDAEHVELLFIMIVYYVLSDGNHVANDEYIINMYVNNIDGCNKKIKNIYIKKPSIKGINIKLNVLDAKLKFMLYKFCKSMLGDSILLKIKETTP